MISANIGKRVVLRLCAALFLSSLSLAYAQPVQVEPVSFPSVILNGNAAAASAGLAYAGVDFFARTAQTALSISGSLPSIPGTHLTGALNLSQGHGVTASPQVPERLEVRAWTKSQALSSPQALSAIIDPYDYDVPVSRHNGTGQAGILELPGGDIRRPELALSEKRRHEALKSNYLPWDGVLLPLSEGELDLWPKLLNTRMDLVALDEDGIIQKVVVNIGHPGKDVPWNKVDFISLKGSHLLLLPSGMAKILGMREGFQVNGSNVPSPFISPRTMSQMILSGEERTWTKLFAYLSENPSADLDEALTLARSELRSTTEILARLWGDNLNQFLDRTLVDKKFPYQLRNTISWYAPFRWVRSLWNQDSGTVAIETQFGSRIYYVLKFGSRIYHVPQKIGKVFLGTIHVALIPSKMLSAFVHESGHLIAAKLAGVKVIRFRIFPNGAGHVLPVTIPNGWKGAAIFLAGPLSQVFWGSFLLFLGALLLPGCAAGLLLLTAVNFFHTSISGGRGTDWPGAAQYLGFTRLAHELRYRGEGPEGRHYLRMLWRMARETGKVGPAPLSSADLVEGILRRRKSRL